MSPRLSKAVPLYLIDRSGAELDDHCGMAFWWNRKEGGKGLVPKAEAEPLRVGAEIHRDMEDLAKMPDLTDQSINTFINGILSLPGTELMVRAERESLYRRLGWFTAWALYIEPRLRERYETVAVEQDLILDRTPLWVPVKPDRLLRDKQTGKLVYFEYKSCLSANQKWLLSWHFQVQLHSSLAAISEELGETVSFAQVVGLLKGKKSDSDHRLLHPYVWGWYNAKTQKWGNRYEECRGAEWQPRPVWEYPGGIIAWVRGCGQDVAVSQFPFTAPVFFNERLLKSWTVRQLHRRKEVHEVEEQCRTDKEMRSVYFPVRTRQCRPAYGDACPYTRLCWNASANHNPSGDPDFEARQPHHEIEIVGIE
jgi:hypothetical protein